MADSTDAADPEPAAEPAGPSLLSRPPEEGARLLALAFLDQAAAARPRLADPEDDEALHDFRVALRRLRSGLRAYRDWLDDSVPKKLGKRLRRLAAATGSGRDAEVQIAWLRSRGRLPPSHRPGLAWLLLRLEERKRQAYAELVEEVADEFSLVESDLRRKLSVYQAEVHLDRDTPRPTLGAATAAILHAQIEELTDHFARIDDPGDEKQAHRARIAAKRLRYLLEPFKGEVPAVAAIVQRLKALQDLLGELHDAHVLEHELADQVAAAAAERATQLLDLTLEGSTDPAPLCAARRRRHEPGLLAFAQANRARRDEVFERLEEGWLQGRADGFLGELSGLEPVLAEGE
ncbi:MAG TPA: CHAD domain-containing protein [Thermoanaerobaculia bacterium]|nr:CHAD domain-containing protein [Thermoanaerobaculia bacterium]